MGRRGRARAVGRFRGRGGEGEGPALNRGDVYDGHFPEGRHPVVVLTREGAIPVLTRVCVAVVTSTVRGIPTEVPVGKPEGLARDCAVNCDNIYTVPKSSLDRYRGSLGPESVRRLDAALRIALGLD